MVSSPLSPQDAAAQLTAFKSYVQLIADSTPGSKYSFFFLFLFLNFELKKNCILLYKLHP